MIKKFKKISPDKLLNIIKKPMMTEKSTNLNQFNQYSFIVDEKSNSNEIKQAIEHIFKVKVIKIKPNCTLFRALQVVSEHTRLGRFYRET